MTRKKYRKYATAPRIYRPGELGYRTRGNLTGLDYFDTAREVGRIEGVFYTHLIRGTLRTSNPVAIIFLFIGSVLLVGAAVGMVAGIYEDRDYYGGLGDFFCVGFMIVLLGVFGLLMLRAALTNTLRMIGVSQPPVKSELESNSANSKEKHETD